MKIIMLLLLMTFLCGCAHLRTETEQVKYDLIGHTMGGREKSWKFQSVDQIKNLTIDAKVEVETYKKVYFVSMLLHDDRVKESYESRAKITYVRNNKWDVESVGLLSIKQE